MGGVPDGSSAKCQVCNGIDNVLVIQRKMRAVFMPEEGPVKDPVQIPNALVDRVMGYDVVKLYTTAEADFEHLLARVIIKGMTICCLCLLLACRGGALQ